MKHIKKYEIFETRTLGTREKYLNALIDEKGILHKRKGFIINVKRKGNLVELIVDSEWSYEVDDVNKDKEISPNRIHEYIAGIDINGYIIGFNFDEKTDQLKNSKGEVVYKEPGMPWKRNSNIEDYKFNYPEYSELVDDLATGWVNVKIDREVVKKVERFSNRLSNSTNVDALREKLNKLKNPLNKVLFKDDDFTGQVQQKISSLLILKYLEEIKEKFNATSGGFLFESFIAGLLGGNVPDDNSKVDIVSKDGKINFQVKLVDWMSDSGNIRLFTPNTVEVEEDGVLKKKRISKNHLLTWQNRREKEIRNQNLFCDFYIIGLKQNNKIYIFILHGATTLGKYLINSGISLSKLREEVAKGNSKGKEGVYFELNLADLENKIEKVADNLKSSLNTIWTNLSDIEYNVESITTGQDKKGQTIEWTGYEEIFEDCKTKLVQVNEELTNLKGVMKFK
jgi:hypothetical protein